MQDRGIGISQLNLLKFVIDAFEPRQENTYSSARANALCCLTDDRVRVLSGTAIIFFTGEGRERLLTHVSSLSILCCRVHMLKETVQQLLILHLPWIVCHLQKQYTLSIS